MVHLIPNHVVLSVTWAVAQLAVLSIGEEFSWIPPPDAAMLNVSVKIILSTLECDRAVCDSLNITVFALGRRLLPSLICSKYTPSQTLPPSLAAFPFLGDKTFFDFLQSWR